MHFSPGVAAFLGENPHNLLALVAKWSTNHFWKYVHKPSSVSMFTNLSNFKMYGPKLPEFQTRGWLGNSGN